MRYLLASLALISATCLGAFIFFKIQDDYSLFILVLISIWMGARYFKTKEIGIAIGLALSLQVIVYNLLPKERLGESLIIFFTSIVAYPLGLLISYGLRNSILSGLILGPGRSPQQSPPSISRSFIDLPHWQKILFVLLIVLAAFSIRAQNIFNQELPRVLDQKNYALRDVTGVEQLKSQDQVFDKSAGNLMHAWKGRVVVEKVYSAAENKEPISGVITFHDVPPGERCESLVSLNNIAFSKKSKWEVFLSMDGIKYDLGNSGVSIEALKACGNRFFGKPKTIAFELLKGADYPTAESVEKRNAASRQIAIDKSLEPLLSYKEEVFAFISSGASMKAPRNILISYGVTMRFFKTKDGGYLEVQDIPKGEFCEKLAGTKNELPSDQWIVELSMVNYKISLKDGGQELAKHCRHQAHLKLKQMKFEIRKSTATQAQ